MKQSYYDVIIIGAGLSGSVLAERFANQNGKSVLIIEKRDHIGGNCYDFINEHGIRESKYGAHLFHTNNEKVWEYIRSFGEWVPWEHKVLGKSKDKIFPIPVNRTTINCIFEQQLPSEAETELFLQNIQIPSNTMKNSEEVALSRVGHVLYERLLKHYTKKQWDKYPSELEPSVLQRIPVRSTDDDRYFTDKYQYLPKNGYTSIFESMLDNIEVILNTDFLEIRHSSTFPKFGLLFFTGCIDQYFPDLPKLEYRSIHFDRHHIDLEENESYFQENSVINYTDSEIPYTRIVEYKHFLHQNIPRKTTIVYETTTDKGEPYYPVPTEKNRILYQTYQTLAEKEESEKNVFFVGRLANYKYFNMDDAILNALLLFEKITKKK